MADRLDMKSMDMTQDNIAKIKALFPSAVTEVMGDDGKVKLAIDFDCLKQELSDDLISEKAERYQMTWPDKSKAKVLANSRINATLRPDKEKSVDFDNTENLYIEGDNLDVLKLLRETYLGKVKMIYIDPPYNTGNDFVYEDDFTMSADDYAELSGQYDEQGNRLVKNLDSNGRFHTDWLNMIYPRLKVARDLLSDDGVIFVSIDDNEYDNLKKLCDEIFGSSNFVANIIWQKKTGASDALHIAIITENILVYAKSKSYLKLAQNFEAHDSNRYRYKDEHYSTRGAFYYDSLDRGTLGYHESLDYPVTAPDGTLVFPNGRDRSFNDGWRWKWGKEKLAWGIKNGFIEVRENPSKANGWGVYYKIYENVDNDGNIVVRSSPYKNLIQDVLNTHASAEAKELFGRTDYFSNPKPLNLIKHFVHLATNEGDIILDFFSGSGTTAHAVMQLNAEDGGNRKFVMVQLPEKCEGKSQAYKAGYMSICDIGQERIRRAGKKIKEEGGLTAQNLDVGFRVLKLDSSNMQDVYYNPAAMTQDLLASTVDNVKADRTPLDLLFQVMLDLGVELSAKIEEHTISGKTYYTVNGNDIIACFDDNIDNDVIVAIAKQNPLYAVFKDKSFATDSVGINNEQLFKTYSPSTVVKVI